MDKERFWIFSISSIRNIRRSMVTAILFFFFFWVFTPCEAVMTNTLCTWSIILVKSCKIGIGTVLQTRKLRIRQVKLFTQSQLDCDSDWSWLLFTAPLITAVIYTSHSNIHILPSVLPDTTITFTEWVIRYQAVGLDWFLPPDPQEHYLAHNDHSCLSNEWINELISIIL